jgi:hypothetical protein
MVDSRSHHGYLPFAWHVRNEEYGQPSVYFSYEKTKYSKSQSTCSG